MQEVKHWQTFANIELDTSNYSANPTVSIGRSAPDYIPKPLKYVKDTTHNNA